MNCMKCGRKIPDEQVFCDKCLEQMEAYPVKPGTVVQLPTQTSALPKKPVRRVLPLEEQNKLLKKYIFRLWGALIFTIVLLIGAIWVAIYSLHDEEFQFLPGQNYSVAETTQPTDAT